MKQSKKVLLTTPDFPPQIGGLSTFSRNIVNSLKSIDLVPVVRTWNNVQDIARNHKDESQSSDPVINIQFSCGPFLPKENWGKHINFYHGSELTFNSPNMLKALYKKVFKNKLLRYMESCRYNLFISEFTLETAIKHGFQVDYARDLVFHNGIELGQETLTENSLEVDELKLICVARDVPHKNLGGVVQLSEILANISQKKITLYITSKRFQSSKINIIDISGISDLDREDYYRQAHFNVLLSLDHSTRGFFEGFGLTVLEAGKFGVPSLGLPHAGLLESIHHTRTGWLLSSLNESGLRKIWKNEIVPNYRRVCTECFSHTHKSHGLERYCRLFEALL